MSTSLYWRSLTKGRKTKDHSLYSIKWDIARKIGAYDGSVGENLGTVNEEFIPFLEMLRGEASKEELKDINKLIAAIEKYKVIDLIIY